jgi:hypothetical protein
MGAVWLARERSLDRLVAIKVLAGDEIGVANVRERFRREARIAAKLVHPNIVPLHAFGETQDALYFVMGYVEGETLATRLEREGRLPRGPALRILGEIADALAFAHREGVIHRDVKPENILLEAKSGRAMLADFGVARLDSGATSVTMTGVAIGTPSYMSPEQAVGTKEIDGRADIYALGVVGYRMLLGRLPFTASTLQGLLAQHAVEKPADLALAVEENDRGIARVLMRALEKDPQARWVRADDLRDALQGAALDTTAMPEELDRIDGLGTSALTTVVLFADFMTYAAFATRAWGRSGLDRHGLALMWDAIVAGGLGIYLAWRTRPAVRAFGLKEALRTLFHPPKFWPWWWPRAFRRPDDQWGRLPALVRSVRKYKLAAVVTVISNMMLLLPAIAGGAVRGDEPFVFAWQAITGAALIASITGIITSSREARVTLTALGLSNHDATKFIELPNVASDPGWRNPQFARILAAASTAAGASRAPQTPAELAAAITALNKRLREVGFLPDDECVLAAESARAAIEALESEVQQLHQDLEPEEGPRLERRLAALRAGAGDPELRRLLEGQQAVLRRLEQQRQEKESRRDRLRDQLVTLWMQLVELNARAARGAQDPELTGQVRSLSTALARAGDAVVEVEQSLLPAPRSRVTT